MNIGTQMRVVRCFLRYVPAISKKHPVMYICFLWVQEYMISTTNSARQMIPRMMAQPCPSTKVFPDPIQNTNMATKSMKSAKISPTQYMALGKN